jgi:adenosylmethionine-8-amino-7-oxononanoate aminotransferase
MNRHDRHPNIWPPFTNLAKEPLPLKVQSAKGTKLFLDDGSSLIDCLSSWWVNLHGHGHPEIVKAISDQATELDHVLFAGVSHNPAEKFAEELVKYTPGALNRVFYSDNGSTANEVALKMALQYWQNIGQKRKRFIAFEGAYHGDTIGAMSVGGPSVFNTHFKEHFFEVDFIPYPETWEGDPDIEEKEEAAIDALEKVLVENDGDYAAIIIEPMMQGAGGMRKCRVEFLQKVHWTQRQFETLLIFDEVMTGFGRTSKLFASEYAQVTPDILCLSKGITGGTLPLAATVVTDQFYEAFIDGEDPYKTFYHGHSYTANPIACAAASASLSLLMRKEANGKLSFENSSTRLNGLFDKLKQHPLLSKPRRLGNILAFDLESDQAENRYLANIGFHIKAEAPKHGLLIRPLGNTLYLIPPYCISDQEVEIIAEKLPIIVEQAYSRK